MEANTTNGLNPILPTYEKALAAAEDMVVRGIDIAGMAVACAINERVACLSGKMKSEGVSARLLKDAREMYSVAYKIYVNDDSVPPLEIVNAIFQCYIDNDMEVQSVKDMIAYGYELLLTNYGQ